jgi:hypothetical protein
MEWKFGVQKCVLLLAPFIRPQEKGLDVALFPVVNSFGVCRSLKALISLSKNFHKTCSVSVMSLFCLCYVSTNPNMSARIS